MDLYSFSIKLKRILVAIILLAIAGIIALKTIVIKAVASIVARLKGI